MHPVEPVKNESRTIPVEVCQWNWGAFFWTWIWGIRFGVWKSLLMFIPIFNIFWWFVLGAKGSQWAWEKNSWSSVEEFKQSQRRWALSGVILWIVAIIIIVTSLVIMRNYVEPLVHQSFAIVKESKAVQHWIGESNTIKRNSISSIDINKHGAYSVSKVVYSISGARGDATVYVKAQKVNKQFNIIYLRVDHGGQYIILRSNQVPDLH